jgi:glucose-1-phosphate cytidylyltransferase
MVEIGGRPILWHIMKTYAHHGVNDFIVCLGYRGYMIKEYFSNYFLHQADVTFDMVENKIQYHDSRSESWRVTLVDTGEETMTGGRLASVRRYLDKGQPFCMTYGDGVSDVDIRSEIAFHRGHGLYATMTCVRPPARFGRIVMRGDLISRFEEKPQTEGGLINGGFFVLQPEVLDYIATDSTTWEREPLERLAQGNQLSGWVHEGFWQPMDTLRDKEVLNRLWDAGKAPWRNWK